MNFSILNRSRFIEQLANLRLDLLVIGGGITGCGIALDAALRGMKVALIEKDDFASGTSSRSTKLIHGGLRYLQQFEFKLVHDVGYERAVVYRNARHLVIPEKMLLPIVEGGLLGVFSTSIGLMVYELLAGVRRNESRKMLNRHEALKAEPLLRFDTLLGAGLYYEYRTDDSRLVIEVAKSAFAQGALLFNYMEATKFLYNERGKVKGVRVYDKIHKREFEIHAPVVVNACGPWVDLLRKADNSLQGKRLQLTKGVHLVFPYEKLPLKQAAYFDNNDGRMIFAIPRNNMTYVGTTDTIYNQDLNNPHCNNDDAQYLLNAVNMVFPSVNLKMQDIISTWAGLRPLIFEEGRSADELSRKDEIIISDSGLISIAGGKLTGYRLMAEKIVDLVSGKSGKNFGSCKTKNFRLSGGVFAGKDEFQRSLNQFIEAGAVENIPAVKIKEWFYKYGSNTGAVIENVRSLRSKILDLEKLLEAAELLYAIENEMVWRLADFLVRRTGKMFFEHENAEKQIEYLANFLSVNLSAENFPAPEDLSSTKEEFHRVISFL